jgi:hypothetical protein
MSEPAPSELVEAVASHLRELSASLREIGYTPEIVAVLPGGVGIMPLPELLEAFAEALEGCDGPD